ncbi:MAG: hypothetical protein ACTHK7_08520, partial [Aureliella sp.]
GFFYTGNNLIFSNIYIYTFSPHWVINIFAGGRGQQRLRRRAAPGTGLPLWGEEESNYRKPASKRIRLFGVENRPFRRSSHFEMKTLAKASGTRNSLI